MTLNNTLTDVPGIRVGHLTNAEAATGCTVILCPPRTTGGVDQRGGAPGTRETDLLRPLHLVSHVNAVVLSGGSAYGLAAADGVMRYLEEQGEGYAVQDVVVPIVPAAILMDLLLGDSRIRPDADMGYAAARAASASPVKQGSVGAGTGCRVGGMMGSDRATKGGIGSASMDLGDGLIVAALMAVNAFGDVID
ncbi:MAG: P1 family peptidase, partial [Chloroflexota bacterium]